MVVLGGLLVFAILFAVSYWLRLSDVQISTHGYIAMALGVVLTFALTVGLMWLTFFSHRHDYDDVQVRDD